jgi:hypothetical protein
MFLFWNTYFFSLYVIITFALAVLCYFTFLAEIIKTMSRMNLLFFVTCKFTIFISLWGTREHSYTAQRQN